MGKKKLRKRKGSQRESSVVVPFTDLSWDALSQNSQTGEKKKEGSNKVMKGSYAHNNRPTFGGKKGGRKP